MGIRYFNYMILLTANRPFGEGEMVLMQEMKKHEIPFAMVRGQMDNTENEWLENGEDVEVTFRIDHNY